MRKLTDKQKLMKTCKIIKECRKDLRRIQNVATGAVSALNRENRKLRRKLWRFEHPEGLENHPAYGM